NAVGCAACHEEPLPGGGGANDPAEEGEDIEVHATAFHPGAKCDNLEAVGGQVIQKQVTPGLAARGIGPEPVPPEATLPTALRTGAVIFVGIGCAAGHVPALVTGPSPVRALSLKIFLPYTDLLLHDMGPALADICLGDALPSEFRTEPLMGLRFATTFLHDGRAATIAEAIRLHGGEASRTRD